MTDPVRKDHPRPPEQRRSSIHEGVETWSDIPCSCEAEPRWQAVEEELAESKSRVDAPAPPATGS